MRQQVARGARCARENALGVPDRRADGAVDLVDGQGHNVAGPVVAAEAGGVQQRVGLQHGRTRGRRRGGSFHALDDGLEDVTQGVGKLVGVRSAEEAPTRVETEVEQVVDLGRVRRVGVAPGDVGARADRREGCRRIDGAIDAKTDAKACEVLPEGGVIAIDRNLVCQVRAQIAFPVMHADVTEGVRQGIAEGALIGVLVGVARRTGNHRPCRVVRVADGGVGTVPETVGHEDVEALATGPGIVAAREDAGLVVPGATVVRALEILSHGLGGAAQRRAVGGDILVVEAVIEVGTLCIIEGAYARDDRARGHAVDGGGALVDGPVAHAGVRGQPGESLADAGESGQRARAVVGEPVGEVLDFLVAGAGYAARAGEGGCGRRCRGDLHERVAGSDCHVAAVVVVVGDRPVGVVAATGVAEGLVEGIAAKPGGNLGLLRREVEGAKGRARRVVGGGRGIGIGHRRTVGVGPRGIGHIGVVEHAVVVRRAREVVVQAVVAERGNLVRVGGAPVGVVRAWKGEDRERELRAIRHELPLHRAGVIESEDDVRVDGCVQEQGDRRDVDVRAHRGAAAGQHAEHEAETQGGQAGARNRR